MAPKPKTGQSNKKAKGNKDKKKDKATKKANSKVPSNVQNDNSKVNNSQELICDHCAGPNETREWLVQCDKCDRFNHFSCAQITEISEDDPWICQVCNGDSNKNESKSSNDESININTSTHVIVTADVHNPPIITLEDIVEQPDETEVSQQATQNKTRNDSSAGEKAQSTDRGTNRSRASSAKSVFKSSSRVVSTTSTNRGTNRSRASSAKSVSKSSSRVVSTTSTNRRRDVELKRIEEELKLQAEIDAETLKLKLEAVKLKESRQKKYLEEKYKTLSDGGSSVVSRNTNATQKSSFVSDWIENQRKQYEAKSKSVDENLIRTAHRYKNSIDEMGFDISIPVDAQEIEQIRATLQAEQKTMSDQAFIDEQVKLYAGWSKKQEVDQSKGSKSITKKGELAQGQETEEYRNSSGETTQQHHQRNVSASVDYQPLDQNQLRSHQQRHASISHTAKEFKMYPRSRSTLLNEQSRPVQNNQSHVQKPNSTYVFSRYGQPTTSCATSFEKPIVSAKTNTLNYPTRLINDSVVTNQVLIPSTVDTGGVTLRERRIQAIFDDIKSGSQIPRLENTSCGNQYYDQLYSFHQPVSLSIQGNMGNDRRAIVSLNQPLDPNQNLVYPVSSNQFINSSGGSFNPVISTISSNQRFVSSQSYFNSLSSNQHMNSRDGSFNTTISASEPTNSMNCLFNTTSSLSQPINSSHGSIHQLLPSNQVIYPNQHTGSTNYPNQPQQNPSMYSSMVNSNNNRHQRVRLPLTPSQVAARHAISKELPKFGGNPKDWCRFITRYINSTGMCGYTEDENLERLDRCLYDKARTLVESLLFMPNSVPEIMETLCEKYGRPELIIKVILNDVRGYPTIRPDKLELLSDYGYAVRNACNQVEDLNLRNYLNNPELIQEIIDKLPFQTKIDWARHSETFGVITLRHLADWLHALSRTINRITSDVSTSSNDQKNSHHGKSEVKQESLKSENSKNGWVYLHDNNNKSSGSAERQTQCLICREECKSIDICPKFKGMDVDQRWKSLLEKKLCRKCLQFHKNKCQISKACGVNGCEFKHHSLLHNNQRHSSSTDQEIKSKNTGGSETVNKNPDNVITGSSNIHYMQFGELFRIVPVQLHANKRIVSTYAYLDEGSSFTLMERSIAEILGLTGTPETICLLWTNKVHRQEESEVVDLEIAADMSENDNKPSTRYPFKSVNVVQELDLPEQSLPLDKLTERYEHLRNIPIAGYENIRPTLLIGIKHARLAVPLNTIEGKEDGPIATRSRLGWSIYGSGDNTSKGFVNTHRVIKCPCQERDDEVHKMIKDHFTVENFGVVVNSTSLDSKENERALKLMEHLTIRKGNRFETGLLWNNHMYQIPDSYGMAKKRLECLENKGSKDIDVINESVQDYVQKGYAHKLSPAELAESHSRVWYLPLFTVTNPKKPEKLRTVFDAAARVKGVSLNSMLHTGPDLVPSIVDILRRFRENKIAFTGDIKEMYHQIKVTEEDKHAQRFLWRNGNKSIEPEIYVMDVLTFGSRSSPCSAQYVKNLNASEFELNYPRASVAIKKNTYVDDLMDGANSINEAIQLIQDTKFVYSQGGFEIRKFKSNSEEVMEGIGEPISNIQVLVDDGANIERVLGMFWDTKSDTFTFLLKYTKVRADVLSGRRLPTKRELLKLLMSIFDPLGMLSYYLIHVKILLQNVWRSNIGWDDVITENLKPTWDQWISILPNVEKLKIPRWYFQDRSDMNGDIELHIFVDASENAYSSVAYLRFKSNYGYACILVGSKARVTPLKYMSIPRKELMASVLGTRLSNSIREGLSLKIHRRVIWSDSSTVLTWLHSDHQRYSQFVAHRVGEILESSELSEWRWVPTKMNVADEATKWSKTPTFVHKDRWFVGPEFLQKPESEWPKPPRSIVPNSTTEEMKLSCSHSGLVMPSVVVPENFSKWERVVRAVAFAIRWGTKLLAKVRTVTIPSGPLTKDELTRSEILLFRQAQWQGFTEEMVALTKNLQRQGKPIKLSKASSIFECSPYLDERGILRVEGRIDNAIVLTMDAKRPIIMPRDNILTKLIMLSYHRKYLHKNHETVINELKQRFYVPRMRVAFRSVRWNCMLCETKRRQPRIPKMADLPAVRLKAGVLPFTYTGIDYFGPMNVMVGRRTEKRWGVLLTCLTIRAIHIEIAPSLDTGSCIKVIRNFINLRGAPAEFFSDRGTNFVAADKELSKELEKLNEHELATAITSCYTKWNFNPPASPHMGGCWEVLIRTVKSCWKESRTTRTPKDEDLRSLLLEIMNIVNARPLTFIPLESDEAEALTPNHFILGSSNGIKPPGKFTNDGPYLRQSWKEIQRCTDIFWNRFTTEYLPTLTRRSKWFEDVKPLEVGDLVIDIDENNFRNTYTRGRIVETIMGSKNQVRRARIQRADGETLWRPAKRLAVLDVLKKSDDGIQTPTETVGLNHLVDDINRGENVGAMISNLDQFHQAESEQLGRPTTPLDVTDE